MNKVFFSNLVPGTLLYSRFRLKRCLHANEIGGVYLCRDVFESTDVALKIFCTDWVRSQEGRDKFEREVNFAFACNHRNIIRPFDCFMDSDFAAFSMEYAERGSLSQVLQQGYQTGGMRTAETLRILLEITLGAEAIHKEGIYHRDLKPDNILLDRNGTVKLADFGISSESRECDGIPSDSLEGSIDYLSPEYIAEGIYDRRSEVYGLGLIAYELFSGRKPFPELPATESLLIRVQGEPLPLTRKDKRVPEAFATLVRRCLQKNPNHRYQTISELRDELCLLTEVGCSTDWVSAIYQKELMERFRKDSMQLFAN